MIKVLFVCHGNICRSVAAEYMFKDMIKSNRLQDKFYCESKATSDEEIGNDIKYDESVFYSYTFNELHNDLLGDPIQLSSMEAEDSLVIGNFISIPAQLQQIYEFKEIK